MAPAVLRAWHGGVLHAVECLSPSGLSEAECGYRFFGFDAVADLMSCARRLSEADAGSDHRRPGSGWVGGLVSRIRRFFRGNDDLESQESQLDAEYAALIPEDSALVERFEEYRRSHPSDFASL